MNDISRRTVLKNGAITAASAAMLTALPKRLLADSLAKSAGIQLYTVDKELKQDMPGTLAKLAAIGYRTVESAGMAGKDRRGVSQGARCCRVEMSKFPPVSETGPDRAAVFRRCEDPGI